MTLLGDEVVNLNANGNALNVNGTSQPDAISYTPTGPSAGSFQNAGEQAFNFTNVTGAFTINPLGGVDTVTVNGTSAGDTIAIIKGATTTVQVGGLKTVSLPAGSAENVTVLAGDGDDTINVSGTTTNSQVININGGDPTASDTLTITMTTSGATTVSPGATPDAGVIATPDGSTTFSGIEAITVTGAAAGANTLTAQGTNANDTIAIQRIGGTDRVWVNNRAVVTFANYAIVNLNGIFGDDAFVVARRHPPR